MPIAANQKVNEGFDYRVNQVEVPHPVTGDKSGYFMNVREDNDEILGWTTDRYGLIQNSDLLDRADQAFSDRGINVERNVIITEDGAKMRAQYDLQGDMFQSEVPEVGDVMAYRLTAQNSFDRSLRVSFATMRLIAHLLNSSPAWTFTAASPRSTSSRSRA